MCFFSITILIIVHYQFNRINRNTILTENTKSNEDNGELIKTKQDADRIFKIVKKSKKDSQLTYMTICVAVVYTIGSIPMILVTPGILYTINEKNNIKYKVFAAIANLLELSQSCLRFFIYFFFTTQFRIRFYSIFSINSKIWKKNFFLMIIFIVLLTLKIKFKKKKLKFSDL